MKVLHCDNHLFAVDKPACQPTVPDVSEDLALSEEARAWIEREFEKPGRAFLGVVHRLDRPVSGVVLFARTSKAAARLTDAFRERRVEKRYLGIVEGWPAHVRGELELWLAKDRSHNRVTIAEVEAPGSKRALTGWRVLERYEIDGERRALLELVPHTGRPHQLRVAMSSLGTPLVGDRKYGARTALPDRSIALHAARLAVDHPTRDGRVTLEAAPPHAVWWRSAGG